MKINEEIKKKAEEKDRKQKEAEEYIIKAKKNLELCKLYKEKGFDYKLPEEWFYTLYLLRISNFVQIWSRE